MKPEEIATLERLCPEAAAVEKSRVKHKNCPVGSMHYERYRREYLQSLECHLPAIAACIVRLGKENEELKMQLRRVEKEELGHTEDCQFHKGSECICGMDEVLEVALNQKEWG